MIFKKKVMEQDLQIPLHNPGHLIEIAEASSKNNRIRKLCLFNLVRFLILILSVVVYFMESHHEYSIFDGHDGTKLFITIAFSYVFSLVIHAYAVAYMDVSEWIFLSNAFWDLVFIISLLLFFDVSNNIVLMGFVIVSSTLLSSLTFSIKQSLVYGCVVACAWIFATSYVRILPLITWPLLEPIPTWQRIVNVADTFVKNRHLLFEPTIFALLITTFSVLIGFLAAMGRENKMSADVNRQYNRQLRELNDSIIADMPNGLLVVNSEKVILTLNREARTIFNLSEDDPVPYYINDLSPEIGQKLWNWNDMEEGNDVSIMLGQRKYSLTFSHLPVDKNTRAFTDQKKLTLITMEDIAQALRKAQESRLSALGHLTTGIAHEIKNPLGIVRGAMDLLAESWKEGNNSKNEYLLEKMYIHTDRIKSIVDDINNLFTRSTCNKKLISVNSFLLRVASEARLNDEMRHATISVDIDSSVGIAIYFDPSYLKQILLNLMLNAVKHSGRSNVQITIRTSLNVTSRLLYIDVMDNGCGVSQEDEENIFMPFFSKRQSTGLGLYLVREMCVSNQAQIQYVRGTGGACFRLSAERLSDNKLTRSE